MNTNVYQRRQTTQRPQYQNNYQQRQTATVRDQSTESFGLTSIFSPFLFLFLIFLFLHFLPHIKQFFISKVSLKTAVKLSVAQAYKGTIIQQDYTRIVTCPVCHGNGYEHSHDVKQCDQCHGHGQVRRRRRMGFMVYDETVTCPKCNGEGKIIENYCHHCGGSKETREDMHVDVKIPAKTSDGKKVIVKKKGHYNDDLEVTVNVIPKGNVDGYQYELINGKDILIEMDIPLKEALLGFERKIEYFDNEIISVKKDTVTQDGEEIVFNKKGLSNGKLIIKIHVNMDDLTDDQIMKIANVLKNN